MNKSKRNVTKPTDPAVLEHRQHILDDIQSASRVLVETRFGEYSFSCVQVTKTVATELITKLSDTEIMTVQLDMLSDNSLYLTR